MRVLRRPRGFGVAGVYLGPLALPSCAAPALGAALAAFAGAAFFASAITIPHHWAQKPGLVRVHVARCRSVRSHDGPRAADGCCSSGRSPSGSAGLTALLWIRATS